MVLRNEQQDMDLDGSDTFQRGIITNGTEAYTKLFGDGNSHTEPHCIMLLKLIPFRNKYENQIIIPLAYLWNELENCIRKESTNGQAHKVS